jgi:hypothetical protein
MGKDMKKEIKKIVTSKEIFQGGFFML